MKQQNRVIRASWLIWYEYESIEKGAYDDEIWAKSIVKLESL